MCKIMEDLAKESKAEGAIETVIKLGRIKNQTDEQIINDLIMVCNITEKEAKSLFDLYKPQIA